MDATVLFFLSSGLFLGWALGANDAANVFGTAVGTRMVRFGTAAAICSVFVILGAVVGGSGAAQTLGKLGAINALPTRCYDRARAHAGRLMALPVAERGPLAGLPRAIKDLFRTHGVNAEHIAALVLSEPNGVAWQLALIGKELNTQIAGERHLRNRNQQAAVGRIMDG